MAHITGHNLCDISLNICGSVQSFLRPSTILILQSGNKNYGTVGGGVGGGETQSVFVELPSAAKTSEFFHGGCDEAVWTKVEKQHQRFPREASSLFITSVSPRARIKENLQVLLNPF